MRRPDVGLELPRVPLCLRHQGTRRRELEEPQQPTARDRGERQTSYSGGRDRPNNSPPSMTVAAVGP